MFQEEDRVIATQGMEQQALGIVWSRGNRHAQSREVGTHDRGVGALQLGGQSDFRPPGEGGRIFVANEMMFDGYTGGGGKEIVGGRMSTGDVGHFDEHGRLYVEGRDDEMIISGGENVFPIEVENLLADHPAIADVAVVGVNDDEWGQRLKAFVVLRPGDRLSDDDVKTYVKERLARYKVPRDVVFLDEVPRNTTGKVLKRTLKEWK